MDNLAFEHGGDIYKIKRRDGKEVIDFSANINPLGLPLKVKKTIKENIDRVLHYPDPEFYDVTQKIAQYWGIEKDCILLGNGSVELIYLITHAFKPKIATIPIPTFSEYERAARISKARVRYVKLNRDFELTLSKIKDSDIIFLCNPNNPTGNLILEGSDELHKLSGKIIVVDEAFMDFLPDEKDYTLIWKAPKNKRIIVIRTFTKFFAIPGLRVGYIVAHPETVKILKKYQPPWSVNALAQLSAETVLADSRYIENTRSFIEKERKFLMEEILRIDGLLPHPSVTNFILIKIVDKGITSSQLRERLIQKGILIRNCSNFRGLNRGFIRIAVRCREENVKLIDCLKEILWKI